MRCRSAADSSSSADGKGRFGKAKDEVPLPARIDEVAIQAVLFLDADGPEAALAMVAQRSLVLVVVATVATPS